MDFFSILVAIAQFVVKMCFSLLNYIGSIAENQCLNSAVALI